MRKARKFATPPVMIATASVVGREEKEGPLGSLFDLCDPTDTFGARTPELGEGEMERLCLNTALTKASLSQEDLDILVAGDLQNQCLGTYGGLYSMGVPFIGIYGACSTCTEGIMLLSELISGGADMGAAVTGSHNSVAERQFRGPLEYGSQRSPSSQWTATAAGAAILCSPDCKQASSSPVRVTEYMAGRPISSGSLDQSNMGGAMAFSAFDTLVRYFSSSDTRYTDLDLIVTGDLGRVGSDILRYLLEPRYPGISSRLCDCGLMLYDRERRDAHSGGSGCGCSASVLASYLYPKLRDGNLRDILFLSTGAIMSVSSVQQGCPIIGITPLIRIRRY